MATDSKYHRARTPSKGKYVKAYQDGGRVEDPPVRNTRSKTSTWMGEAAQINPGGLSSSQILDRAKDAALKDRDLKKAEGLAKASGTQRSKEWTRAQGITPYDEKD